MITGSNLGLSDVIPSVATKPTSAFRDYLDQIGTAKTKKQNLRMIEDCPIFTLKINK